VSEPAPLDLAAVDALAGELMQVVRAHYLRRPMDRQTVFEVLNGLACATGFVLGGIPATHRQACRVFFNQAMIGELVELEKGRQPEPGSRH
jgi:hypothetical protein